MMKSMNKMKIKAIVFVYILEIKKFVRKLYLQYPF